MIESKVQTSKKLNKRGVERQNKHTETLEKNELIKPFVGGF